MAVTFQATPNPNAGKFVVGRPVVSSGGSLSFFSAEQAGEDPIGSALFGIAGVASVFMVEDFVTVTKTPEAGWTELVPLVTTAIEGALP